MISYIKGNIQHIDIKYIVVMTQGGVGYKIFTSIDTVGHSKLGEPVELWVHTVVREDALDLYGFENRKSLHFFELLLTVSGIGPKSAIGILSSATVDTILDAIRTGETGYLTKIGGIGKKVADKIILELKGKISDSFGDSDTSSHVGKNSDVDVIEALKSLGYSHKEAKDILEDIPRDISDTKEKIKFALRRLAK